MGKWFQDWRVFLLFFLGLFVWMLNASFPLIGHDFFYFFPRLLAGKMHFAQQGLAPFLYTPHFCGGIPQYGNPQGMYYSLQQLFVLGFDLWWSVQAAMIFYLLLGYVGWYLFARDVMQIEKSWSHVLALVVLANGYYVLHMAVGHIASLTLPLTGFLLWLLLKRSKDTKISLLGKAGLFGLLCAAALYSGGYLVLLYTGMGFVLLLPVELLLSPQGVRERCNVLFPRVLACTGAALCLSASKLVSILSLMRFFPRDLPFKVFPADESVFLFILRSFFAIPQREMVFSPDEIGVHDYSVFVSPAVLLGLVCGVLVFLRSHRWSAKHSLLILYGIVVSIFFLQLTRGEGALVNVLQQLPVFRSLHIVTRFLVLPALGLSIVGVWNLSKYFRSKYAPALCSSVTLIALFFAYAPLLTSTPDAFRRTLPVDQVRAVVSRGLATSITEVVSWRGVAAFKSLTEGVTNIECTEPLFGTLTGGVHTEGAFADAQSLQEATKLTAGPVRRVEGGVFNLQNPACFLFPEENNCQPFDRIAAQDSNNLSRFTEGRPVTWKVSALQRTVNWISVVTLLLCTAAVVRGRRTFSLRSPSSIQSSSS